MSETVAQTEYARGVAAAVATLKLMLDVERENARDNSEANPAVSAMLLVGRPTQGQHRRMRAVEAAHRLHSDNADILTRAVSQVSGLVS
jgi:hypothetical protein